MGDSVFNNSGNLTNAIKGLVTGNGGRGFQPNADRFTTIVDSGTSDHLVAKNKCMLRSGNNTPEEATVSETKRQRAQIQGSTPEEDTVAEVERQREHILDRPQQHASNLLDEAKSSTTTAGASSTGAGVSSPRAGTPSPRADDSSSGTGTPSSGVITSISPGDAPVASPGVAPSSSAGITPGAPHHETASTRPNPSVEETFDSTHAKGASGAYPPATCVDFAYTNRDPFRISEEENWVIKIPNEEPRCHPIHGAASSGTTGSSTSGIIGTFASGIIGAITSGFIGASTSGVTGSPTSGASGITGSSAGSSSSGSSRSSAGSSSSGITGAPAETSPPASPGVVSASRELRLARVSTRAEPSTIKVEPLEA